MRSFAMTVAMTALFSIGCAPKEKVASPSVAPVQEKFVPELYIYEKFPKLDPVLLKTLALKVDGIDQALRGNSNLVKHIDGLDFESLELEQGADGATLRFTTDIQGEKKSVLLSLQRISPTELASVISFDGLSAKIKCVSQEQYCTIHQDAFIEISKHSAREVVTADFFMFVSHGSAEVSEESYYRSTRGDRLSDHIGTHPRVFVREVIDLSRLWVLRTYGLLNEQLIRVKRFTKPKANRESTVLKAYAEPSSMSSRNQSTWKIDAQFLGAFGSVVEIAISCIACPTPTTGGIKFNLYELNRERGESIWQNREQL